MPRVPARTVPDGHSTSTAGRRRPSTGRAPRTSGLAGVVTVVLATLMAVLAQVPAAAVVPGANGPIAFTSFRDSNAEIYVMNADGTNPTRLTINPATDIAADWGVQATQRTATTTALNVTPASPAAANTTETLTATVTPSAAGSVQFKDGKANIGSAVAVSGGTATFTTTLPPGTHSLTAVFTPTDPASFGSSTSNMVTYVVKCSHRGEGHDHHAQGVPRTAPSRASR